MAKQHDHKTVDELAQELEAAADHLDELQGALREEVRRTMVPESKSEAE